MHDCAGSRSAQLSVMQYSAVYYACMLRPVAVLVQLQHGRVPLCCTVSSSPDNMKGIIPRHSMWLLCFA